MSHGRRFPLRVAALAAAAALVAAGCFPASPTPVGRQIRDLYGIFFAGGAIVTLLVWGLLAWVVIRYRRRDDRVPRQVRGYLPLQVAWTVVPLAVVAGLFVLTLRVMGSVQAVSPDPGVQLHVTAFRWQWRFDYPGRDVTVTGTANVDPEAVVPVGVPIHVTLDSPDVAHSFYVPAFLFKRDAIPGLVNHFDFVVDEPGVYRGQCAELCGVFHASMRFDVRAVTPQEFEAWIGGHGAATPLPSGTGSAGVTAPPAGAEPSP